MTDIEEHSGHIQSVRAEGGIMVLEIKDRNGIIHTIFGDNGPTVRALMRAFGDGIVSGHSLIAGCVIGLHITYGVDNSGILAYIKD